MAYLDNNFEGRPHVINSQNVMIIYSVILYAKCQIRGGILVPELIMLLELIITVFISIAIFKNERCKNVKRLLYKIFWIEIISDESRFRDKLLYKFLNFGSKVFMYPYVFITIYALIAPIIALDLLGFIASVFMLFMFPTIYRLVMGFQLKIHGIK